MLKASLLAEAANNAYSNAKHSWEDADIAVDYEIVTDDEGRKVQVLSPRGTTSDARDWLLDFSAFPPHLDYDIGFVPPGFDDAADMILPDVYRGIDPTMETAFGAHSLGGSIAVHLAAKLAKRGVPIYGIWTFGCPRSGSYKLRRLLRRYFIQQFKRGNDIVPDVPWLPFVYVHQRPLIHIGQPQIDPLEAHHAAGYVADIKAAGL